MLTASRNGLPIVAQRTVDFLAARKVPHYLRQLRSRSGSTDNHATSGLKFQVLAELLHIGVSVLLSDVDVVWTADPFGAPPLERKKRRARSDAYATKRSLRKDAPRTHSRVLARRRVRSIPS